MKAIQCCYFLALVSSHLMAGVMGDDNIFLSNSDSAALYCVAKIFPDGENTVSYTHFRANETKAKSVCRLLLAKKKNRTNQYNCTNTSHE
ncbi:hypothetical protein KJR58_24095 [Escherichia coli]|uniref:hypothetical protein n=1 Tax=Escherichia coli TaxID=562 RepID=UPI00200450EE|nr:hypothetical protein [Escherichia coli]MCK4212219.1 hypothetical protein [Escherichia coli]